MMLPKRLIEVDLPIKRLSALKSKRPAGGDIDVRKGLLWWSRKPQNQCRAILMAALLYDPADPLVTEKYVTAVRELLRHSNLLTREGGATRLGLRSNLFGIIESLADPKAFGSPNIDAFLEKVRKLHGIDTLVALDPFSGSGAIPVEAQRLGFMSIAGEYNPLAAASLRFLMEDGKKLTAKSGTFLEQGLANAVERLRVTLSKLYPQHPEFGQPIGYIKFRRLVCEGPRCGSILPATTKFVLSSAAYIGVDFVKVPKPGETPILKVLQKRKGETFPSPTLNGGALTCPACGFTTPRNSVVRQWLTHQLAPVLVGVVYQKDGCTTILNPTDEQLLADAQSSSWIHSLSSEIPDEQWPQTELRRFSPPLYGYTRFADCHTGRQLVFLALLTRELKSYVSSLKSHDQSIAKDFCALLLADGVDKNSAFCRWRNDRGGSYENTFAGKSLGMIWDFFEADPLGLDSFLNSRPGALFALLTASKTHLKGDANVINCPAQELPLPDDSVDIIYTDPPYFDAIPYSHLSDWAFVWVRRAGFLKISNGEVLSPKRMEIVVDRPHSRSPSTHDASYFTVELKKALGQARRVMKPNAIGVVVFAHSSTAGWEALLEALLSAGFIVTASWPVDTERGGRLQAQGTASLESSIHIVCRPRAQAVGNKTFQDIGDWRDVLQELPKRIHDWMPRLASEGVVGADAIFACLGPALEIFSRYARVERASGEQVTLKEYLEHVWGAVSKEALSMIFTGADTSGFEEDARLTAMWLWTLTGGTSGGAAGVANDDDADSAETPNIDDDDAPKSKETTKGFVLEFDAARKIAQGLGAHLENLSNLVEIKGDKARLLPVGERTRHLFGRDEDNHSGTRKPKKKVEKSLFAELDEAESDEGGWARKAPTLGQTVLDRIHQSMLLFASGRSDALKRFIQEDGAGKDARFWRLAQAMSALYPTGCDEKRWVDGVLARKKGLGF